MTQHAGRPNRIGYIGLGAAGGPMARKLVEAGHALVVHDQGSDVARRFAEATGATVAERPQAFAECGLVVTMLPNGDVVRDALVGSGGVASHLQPGTIVVDTSSSDPFATRRLGAELAERRIHLVDAPVTREVPGHDHLRLMVGGDDETVRRVMPVLSVLAEKVFHVGSLGAGHATKTLNNFVAAAGLVAALDAMAVGREFGLDPRQLMEVLSVGTGQNFSTRHVLANESLTRSYGSGFRLDLLIKDLRICCGLVQRSGFPTGLPAYLQERMAAAGIDLSDPGADHAKAVEHWEHRAGRSLTE